MAPRSMIRKVRPKKSYFSSAWEYVKLSFLRVPKIVICVSRPKRCPSLGFLVLKTGEDKGHFLDNDFGVRLGTHFEKHELIIVNFEVIFDRCQILTRFL
jgi:hypothetical protein